MNTQLHIPFYKRFSEQFFEKVPSSAGVFWFQDSKRKLLMLGATESLKVRLYSFKTLLKSQYKKKHNSLLHEIHEIKWAETQNIKVADKLVEELKAKHQPKYGEFSLGFKNYSYINVIRHENQFIISYSSDYYAPGCFGAFKGRLLVQQVNSALVHFLWAHFINSNLMLWPQQIVKSPPPSVVKIDLKPLTSEIEQQAWYQFISDYFNANNDLLIRHCQRLLNKATLDNFTKGVLEKDLEVLVKFYKNECTKNKKFMQMYKLKSTSFNPEWLPDRNALLKPLGT